MIERREAPKVSHNFFVAYKRKSLTQARWLYVRSLQYGTFSFASQSAFHIRPAAANPSSMRYERLRALPSRRE